MPCPSALPQPAPHMICVYLPLHFLVTDPPPRKLDQPPATISGIQSADQPSAIVGKNISPRFRVLTSPHGSPPNLRLCSRTSKLSTGSLLPQATKSPSVPISVTPACTPYICGLFSFTFCYRPAPTEARPAPGHNQRHPKCRPALCYRR